MIEDVVDIYAVGVRFKSVEMHIFYVFGVCFPEAFRLVYGEIAVVLVVNVINAYGGAVKTDVVLL